MLSLQMRMGLLLAALFAIIYAVVVMVGTSMGHANFTSYLFISIGMMLVQYLIGPKIVEWTMGVHYLERADKPELFSMVEDMCRQAKLPMPRLAISSMDIPNAFAFGRGPRDGRVCVTEGLLGLLDRRELRAVLGHELSHLKNRDVLTVTLLSVIPMILYRLAWSLMYSGGRRDEEGRSSGGVAAGMAAFVFYFITNLLVLYASRIREYYADKGSVELGNRPADLASALYKLVYGSARLEPEEVRQVEGMKAFFANDPSRARSDIAELAQLDLDRSGTIDAGELARLSRMEVRIGLGDRIMEFMSTHPNMLKRIKHLSLLA
jgi:heat shock protein HtpX